MSRVYLDAAVFVHALGREGELRRACQRLLDAMESHDLVGESAVLVIDEVTHVRFRRLRDRTEAAREARDVAAVLLLHEVSPADIDRALDLFEGHDSLDMRDALHAAVAQRAGLDTVVTTDSDFDGIAGLLRVDPRDAEALAKLAG